jgi:hypothetical protein
VIYGSCFSHLTQRARNASESLNAIKNANVRTHEIRESDNSLNQ